MDQFEQPNFEPSDFSLFAYDAILAIREYIDANVEDDQCTISFDGADVINGLTREQFKFDGLTGEVQFNKNGARTVKTSAVKVANIRFYKVTSSVGDFKAEDVTVGLFDGNFWNLQNDMLFTGGSSKAPLLVDPPTDISRFEVNDDIKIATVTLGAFTLVTVGLMFLFIFKSKKKNVIKAAQPMFLNIMLVGIILSTASVFILPRENAPDSDGEEGTSFNCNIPFFLISLGVTISYAGLIFKLQRVVKVANTTPELRDNKVYTMWDSMKSVIIIVIMNIALIIAAYIHNPLVLEQRIIEEDEFGQPLETFDICVPDSNGKGEVYGVLLLFHSLFYFYGFRLICKTRGLSTDFQEGKWIAISVISQFQLYLLGIPVVVAVGQEEPGIRYLVVSLIVIFSNLILMSLIFIPKMYRVFTGDDEVVWSDRGINSGLQHYSTRNAEESRKYQSVRKSLFNTMATQDFGHEVTL